MRENCNQCGKLLEHQAEVGLAFNMGHGPIYICTDCKPPARADEIKSDFEDFMKGVDNTQG